MSSLTTLFTKEQLAAWLRQDVTDDQLTAVESVVWGWIAPVLANPALTDRPDALTASQYSAALELGGIAYTNPDGLSSYELEQERSVYSSERRDEILARVAAQAGTTVPGVGVPAPVGCFPRARRYPDPAERHHYFGRW